MKDKTITVRVPDFCPEDCPELEIHKEVCEFRTIDKGWAVYERAIRYSCEREGDCRRLYGQLETRYCAECREAMKARDEI